MPFAAVGGALAAGGLASAGAGALAAGVGGALASGVIGDVMTPSGGSSGGGQQATNPYGQIAQGASNIAGGALSAVDAQNFANQLSQTANPFGQYNQQFGAQLAGLTNQGAFGSPGSAGQTTLGNYANNTAANLYQSQNSLNSWVGQSPSVAANATNGVNAAAQQGQAGLGGLNLGGINSQISSLVANPGSIYNTPQYQAAFGQGQNAVNATLAAQGLNASGNQLAALQNYGQTFGQNAYNTQLSQLSGLSGQAAAQQQQGYGQQLGAAELGLSANQQVYGQLQGAAQTGMNINQQGFNQLLAAQQSGQQAQQQGFNQLSQLSGLATGSPTAAAAAQAQVYGNVNSAYNSVGQGIGQVASGAGNLLNGLNTSSGGFTGGYTGDFNSGLGTSTSGSGIAGSGALYGTSAGQSGADYTYGGSNSWGFTG